MRRHKHTVLALVLAAILVLAWPAPGGGEPPLAADPSPASPATIAQPTLELPLAAELRLLRPSTRSLGRVQGPTTTPEPPTATPTPVPQATATAPVPGDKRPAPTVPAAAAPAHVTAVGDSVLLGAADDLRRALDDVEVDAVVGRQVSEAIGVLRQRRAAGGLGAIVLIHIGNNGPLSAAQFAEMMQLAEGARRVVVVNLKVSCAWEAGNNAVLAEGVERYPNVVLVDWHGASATHPELFWSDGVHLRPEGARAYADLVLPYLQLT